MQSSKSNLKDIGIYFLSASLCFLAAAIGYFSYQVASFRAELPAMLDSIDRTSGKIEPVLKEINDVRELIPPVLEEVGRIRALIPDVLDEVAATRKAVPPILDEVEKTRKEFPAVLKTVDNASDAVNNTAREIEAIRPMVPEIISEIEATRNAIDPALDRAEHLIKEAQQVGQKTTEGAITGVVTGVVKSPFSLLGGLGKGMVNKDVTGMKEFSDEDMTIVTQTLSELITKPVGTKLEWNNPSSEISGTLTLVKTYTSGGKDCVTIRNDATKQNKQIANKQFGICLNENNEWIVDN